MIQYYEHVLWPDKTSPGRVLETPDLTFSMIIDENCRLDNPRILSCVDFLVAWGSELRCGPCVRLEWEWMLEARSSLQRLRHNAPLFDLCPCTLTSFPQSPSGSTSRDLRMSLRHLDVSLISCRSARSTEWAFFMFDRSRRSCWKERRKMALILLKVTPTFIYILYITTCFEMPS